MIQRCLLWSTKPMQSKVRIRVANGTGSAPSKKVTIPTGPGTVVALGKKAMLTFSLKFDGL